MRRTLAAATAAVLTGLLVLGGAAPATAATYTPPPVADIPDVPSNTLRMTQTASGSWTASDWWRYVGWKIQQPGTTVATIPNTTKTVAVVPKPITAPAAFARGAAGGPLIGSFLGGFAIGTAGIEVYGTITGTDPLQTLCGTSFEGAGSILYMGTMPDCAAQISAPNTDITPGLTPINYPGATMPTWRGATYSTVVAGGQSSHCFSTSGTGGAPAGMQWMAKVPTTSVSSGRVGIGNWSPASSNSICNRIPATGTGYITISGQHTAQLPIVLVRNADQSVVAEQTMQTANPSRSASCTIGWKDGTTTSGAGKPYYETAGLPLSAAGLGCKSAWDAKPGAGREVMPDRIDVDSTTDTGAKTEIARQDVPDFSPTERIALDPTLGNGRGLVLEKVVDGERLSCMDWTTSCAQWWETTSQGTTEGPYRCTYGGAPLSVRECGPYRYTFDQRTASPTVTDPSTGTQTPWQTAPQPGNSLNPGTGPGTGNNPAGDCFAAGWASMNPIEWVLTPVKCALVWAFVPRTAVVTAAQINTQAAWLGSTPGKLAVAIGGISTSLGSLGDTSCGGLILPVPKIGAGWSVSTENRAFLAACPGDFFAPWAGGFYWFISAALVFGGLYAVKRLLDRFVGM